jgi:hypothetical protein
MRLRQPYRIGDLAIESILHQTSERSRCVLRSQKYIEIFGIAADTCVFLQGNSSRYGKWNSCLIQEHQDITKQCFLLLRQLLRSGRGQRTAFRELAAAFGHEHIRCPLQDCGCIEFTNENEGHMARLTSIFCPRHRRINKPPTATGNKIDLRFTHPLYPNTLLGLVRHCCALVILIMC